MIDFVVAIGLVLVIEGVLFALLPGKAQEAMRQAAETPADMLRVVGLVSAVVGVIVIWLGRRFFGA
jgi:uncharacterized protein YjeT (DUF2065 family)